MIRRLLCIAALLLPAPALAHGGAHIEAEGGWSADPLVIALLLGSVTLYGIGIGRMGTARAAIAPPARIAAYVAGIVTLVAALLSPIDGKADTSFAWHMAQHLLLMVVAAPLFAVSNSHLVDLFAFPVAWRRRIGRFFGAVPGVRQGVSRAAPWIAGAAFALGLWVWHAPSLYQAALTDPTLHTFEHITFLFTAAVFWRMVSTSGDRRLDAGSAILLVTLVGLQGNLMAALITLAPAPIYGHYAGSGALADQQIAGMLMWVPAGLIYLASTVHAIWRMLHAPVSKRLHYAGALGTFLQN